MKRLRLFCVSENLDILREVSKIEAMASKNSIPVPPPLKIQGGALVANWKWFKALWQNYELATDIQAESKQRRAAIYFSRVLGPKPTTCLAVWPWRTRRGPTLTK